MQLFDEKKFNEIWMKNPLVILDANILLNIYEYSTETSESILSVFEHIMENHLWIPHQAMREYKRNKQNVLNSEYDKYAHLKKEVNISINKFEAELSKKFLLYKKFKFSNVGELETNIDQELSNIKSKVEVFFKGTELKDSERGKFLREDKIGKLVNKIESKGKCGNGFKISELIQIYQEGEIRYKYKIPPGYEDGDKDKSDETKTRKYGDLIFWKQILEKANREAKDVLLVTAEEKEDWWLISTISGNKHISAPRKELIKEFEQNTENGIQFNMIPISEFLSHIFPIIKFDNAKSIKAQLELNAIHDTTKELHYKWFKAIELKVENHLENEGSSDITYLANTVCDVDIVDNIDSDYPEIIDLSIAFSGNEIKYSILCKIETSADVYAKLEYDKYPMGNVKIEIDFEMEVSRSVDYIKGTIGGFNDNLNIHSISINKASRLDGNCVFCRSEDIVFLCSEGYVCETCSHENSKYCIKCLNPIPLHEIGEDGLCFNCSDKDYI